MRKVLVSALGAVALAIGSTSVASAADLRAPVRKAPAPVAVYNWTGFYIGAHVGGAWGTKDWFDRGNLENIANAGSHDVSGVIAGGQIGFNWQAPGSNWVIGVEAQASWADLKGDHAYEDNILKTRVDWLGTVAGRVGYAWDRALVYAKGGFAFAHDKHEQVDFDGAVVDPFDSSSGKKTRTGWMVGGGIEFALGGNWSAKGEYNYMDFGSKGVTFTFPGGDSIILDIDQQIHVAKFGINYRFGGPVVARY